MPLPLKDYVSQVLLEHNRAGQLHAAIARAWQKACEAYPQRSTWQRKATFRNLVWEAAVREVAEISFSDPDFHTVSHKDTMSFIIEGAVLFRVKHASVELRTANYPTGEAVQFDDHDVDLYGYRGLQRVELVYVLNKYETELAWIGIAARDKGKFLWKIELSSTGIATEVVEELPIEDVLDPEKIAKIKEIRDADKDKKIDRS